MLLLASQKERGTQGKYLKTAITPSGLQVP